MGSRCGDAAGSAPSGGSAGPGGGDGRARELARAKRTSLTRVAADTLRAGLLAVKTGKPNRRPLVPVFDLGKPRVNLDHALRLAAEMEDEEILRKMEAGK